MDNHLIKGNSHLFQQSSSQTKLRFGPRYNTDWPSAVTSHNGFLWSTQGYNWLWTRRMPKLQTKSYRELTRAQDLMTTARVEFSQINSRWSMTKLQKHTARERSKLEVSCCLIPSSCVYIISSNSANLCHFDEKILPSELKRRI